MMWRGFIYLMSGIYVIAGVNHFINPEFYIAIMPRFLAFKSTLNYLAGFMEMSSGLLLIPVKTRVIASWLIICLLMAFIPVHIYLIQQAPLKVGEVYISETFAWLRLPIQIFLVYWAWLYTKRKNDKTP